MVKQVQRWVVLGCGPSGLIAAHALATAGEKFIIFSQKRKSPMYGAQLLEAEIPGITETVPSAVTLTMEGDIQAYVDKVYSDSRALTSRPQDQMYRNSNGDLEWVLKGWDIRQAYDRLWDLYQDRIVPWSADHRSVAGLQLAWPDAIFISTIPAKLLCGGWCNFQEKTIWCTGTWEAETEEDNRVYYGTDPNPARWYRTARIHGCATTEWPDAPFAPHPKAARVVKPEATDCTCHPDITRMGRFGLWKTGVLAHEAWAQTQNLIVAKSTTKESAA